MDIDFYSDNHFNIKDIKDIFNRLNKNKTISRSVIEFAYSYNKDKTKDITDGMLTIFDKVDSKGKIKDEIEIKELAEFLDEVVKAAGDDMDLSKEEAETITSKMSESSGDNKVTTEHLFNFLRVLQVNMEPSIYTDDAIIMDEIVVTPGGSSYRDNIYQKGQVVSINKNEFGRVHTWVELAKRLYKEDGFDESGYTSVEWNNRANELRNMNGNKPLKDLDRVNVKMSNYALLNNKERLLDSFEMYMDNMAVPLAKLISKTVKDKQTTESVNEIKKLFDNNEINSENIVPLFNAYMSDKNILNGDTSLLDAIMSETAFFITTRTEVRQMQRALMDRIVELLNKAAEDAGVQPDVIAQFSSSLSGQLANIFVWENLETLTSKWDDGMKKEKFEGTIKSYIATIISAKRVKEIDDPLALADKAVGDNKVILDNLSEMYKNYDDDQGWFSNFVDGVTGLFGARTRGDIEKLLKGSKEDLDALETAIKSKNYKKFKEAYFKCFGMPFDPRVIQAQNEVGTKLALVGMANNLQLAICQDTKQDMLKYVDDSMKKVIDEQCIAIYGKSMQACSDAELKSVLQSFYDIYSQIRDGILSVTPKSKLESDYERLTAASPMLIVQNQVESYMQNQSTCVACAEIVGDIVATALIPGGSLLLLGKLGRWGYKAKNVINIACKVMDGNGKLAVARNVLKTGAVVYANHRLTYGQNALESLKAAGEMSLFGLVGFGNSTLARLLINSSKFPSIAKFGQDAASMLGDAAFMELFNKVSGNDLNLAQDLAQFLAIYILGKLMHSAVNGENKLTKDEQDLMNKIVKELGLPEGASQLKTSHLLTYAKKNIKDSKLVKSIEKFLKNNDKKPNSQDLLHGNENFYKDFLKTGKPYEIAECEDGTYILRFKDNSLNTGDKYTYCVLDKNMKLVAKHENLTPNDAAQRIENHDSLKFEYHSQNSNPVYVSFDAGLLETVTKMIKRLYSQHKCKTLMNKIDKINETLNFYGLKEGDLKALSETEMNKLIENLDIFETATQNMPEPQKFQLGKLFQENPNMTTDLATMEPRSILQKVSKNADPELKSAIKTTEQTIIDNNFKKLLVEIGVDNPETQNLLCQFMKDASSRIDSDTQVDITNAQLDVLKSKGATTENTYILAPRPKGAVKSYTNAARDIIEISNTEGSNLKLDPNNARTQLSTDQIFGTDIGKKLIVIGDDCSMSGASMLEDALCNIKIGNSLKAGQELEIVFSPTVLGDNATATINKFIKMYEEMPKEDLKALQLRLDKEHKKQHIPPDLDGLSQQAIDFYKFVYTDITDGHTLGNPQRTIISTLCNAKNNKGGKVTFTLADVSDKCPKQNAKKYTDTEAYQRASQKERNEIDAWLTAEGQSYGYRNNASLVVIEGYNGNGYDFGNNTTNQAATDALGINQALPVRGNAPNNNVILTQLYAIASSVNPARIKASGILPNQKYYEIIPKGLTTNISTQHEGAFLTGNKLEIEFKIKKGGLSDGKIRIGDKVYDADNCNIEIMTKDGDILYSKNIQGVPADTPAPETIAAYRQQLQPDVINPFDISLIFGKKQIDVESIGNLKDFNGLQENYVFAIPKSYQNKIVVKVNGEIIMAPLDYFN